MTINQMISRVRKTARVHQASEPDSDIISYLSDAQEAFARDSGGLFVEAYLAITQKFDVWPIHGFAIETDTISRTTVTATTEKLTDADGPTVASMLQSQIDSALSVSSTVSYDKPAMRFAVTIPGAAHIQISGPDDPLYPWVHELFGTYGKQLGSTWYGGHPLDSTVETNIPGLPLSVEQVEWDKRVLRTMPYSSLQSAELTGDPAYYAIMGTRMRLFPTPTERKSLHVFYYGFPGPLPSDLDVEVTEVPSEYHLALVYYGAHIASANNFEYPISEKLYGKYMELVRDFKVRRANNNSKMDLSGHATLRGDAAFPVTGRVIT